MGNAPFLCVCLVALYQVRKDRKWAKCQHLGNENRLNVTSSQHGIPSPSTLLSFPYRMALGCFSLLMITDHAMMYLPGHTGCLNISAKRFFLNVKQTQCCNLSLSCLSAIKKHTSVSLAVQRICIWRRITLLFDVRTH